MPRQCSETQDLGRRERHSQAWELEDIGVE